MSLGRRSKTDSRKRERIHPGSGKGIFIAERRKYPRFSVELPLDYSIDNEEHYGGVAADSSRGGLVAYFPVAIPVGTSLRIEIIFADGFELSSVKARAKVIWSHWVPKVVWGEYEYGLEFEKLQEKDVQKLKTLLREAGEVR